MKKFRLLRTEQCEKCPWKKTTNPLDIPNYDEKLHLSLKKTISEGHLVKGKINIMSCHESSEESHKQEHCIGWLYHQIGRGNNIALRLRMMYCENAQEIKIHGEQHESFEDTIPS
jgi:hypothetical protein